MPKATDTKRLVVPLREKYFCDGAYYVIMASSLGGYSTEEMAKLVSEGGEDAVPKVLKEGACIPICFQGDCAMDNAIIVVGDLTQQEEDEWIGKIPAHLKIPCGKLIVCCGGGDSETLDAAVSGEGMDGFKDFFQVIEVEPGDYLVEVYAYMASTTGNFYFGEDCDEPTAEWKKWYQSTRPGEALPKWLETIKKYDVPGELEELVSYIIRIAPLNGKPAPMPTLDEDIGWCTFERREPAKAPVGITRASLLG